MESTLKLTMFILVMVVNGEAKYDTDNSVKELIEGMNERLTITEQKLQKSQEDFKKAEDELKKTQNELKDLKEEVSSNDIQELREKIQIAEDDCSASKDNIAAVNHELKMKGDYLEKEINSIRNQPFFHTCGSHNDWFQDNYGKIINYTSLDYTSTNTEGGGLDISTGLFTSPHPGSYLVTWSLNSNNEAGDIDVYIMLRKNYQEIRESFHSSWYTGPSGLSRDQGGRTLVLHLDEGDILDLFCLRPYAGIFATTFCVSLLTPDIG